MGATGGIDLEELVVSCTAEAGVLWPASAGGEVPKSRKLVSVESVAARLCLGCEIKVSVAYKTETVGEVLSDCLSDWLSTACDWLAVDVVDLPRVALSPGDCVIMGPWVVCEIVDSVGIVLRSSPWEFCGSLVDWELLDVCVPGLTILEGLGFSMPFVETVGCTSLVGFVKTSREAVASGFSDKEETGVVLVGWDSPDAWVLEVSLSWLEEVSTTEKTLFDDNDCDRSIAEDEVAVARVVFIDGSEVKDTALVRSEFKELLPALLFCSSSVSRELKGRRLDSPRAEGGGAVVLIALGSGRMVLEFWEFKTLPLDLETCKVPVVSWIALAAVISFVFEVVDDSNAFDDSFCPPGTAVTETCEPAGPDVGLREPSLVLGSADDGPMRVAWLDWGTATIWVSDLIIFPLNAEVIAEVWLDTVSWNSLDFVEPGGKSVEVDACGKSRVVRL
jgi:hypothetical protein